MKRAIAIVALSAGAVVLSAAPAWGHSFLVTSTPVAGETLTTLPEAFSVTMNEDLLDLVGDGTGFGLEVRDATGTYYGDGCLTIDGATLSTPAALGAAGDYEVVYQVVSADGHPVSDTIAFEWAPAADFVPAEGFDAPQACGATEEPEPPVPAEPDAESAADISGALWLGGGLLAAVAAVGVTLLAVRKKK